MGYSSPMRPVAPLRLTPAAACLAPALATHAPAAARAAAGLFARDPATWSRDPAVQQTIAQRLGWLAAPREMRPQVARAVTLAARVRHRGIRDVVLLGMGGSSLAPEVLRTLIGPADGAPRFQMLDSTDPAAVQAAMTDPATTLYVIASKSGTTTEPLALAAYCIDRLRAHGIDRWADHLVAVTDPGTPLAARARDEQFFDSFLNDPTIGGRFSALSWFGLVPAALMGIDVVALLDRAVAMLDAAQQEPDAQQNPAAGLGLLIAAAAREGRDKLTLLTPPSWASFGLWVEQLVGESTGKHGVGVIPISGESVGAAAVYGRDRLLVMLDDGAPSPWSVADAATTTHALADVLPGAALTVTTPLDLGAEFMRWEIATAVAGALLDVNPFDEPNVQQAKQATTGLLDAYGRDKTLPVPPVDATDASGTTWTLGRAARTGLDGAPPQALLRLLVPGDYLAVLAYLGPDAACDAALDHFRTRVRDTLHVATMVSRGPRYLHSTGQLHKGGPNSAVCVIVTASAVSDLAVPGAPYTFGVLEQAQALGDARSLETAGRRVLHIHLPSPSATHLQDALDALMAALA